MQYLTTRTMEWVARATELSIVHLETCMHPLGLAMLRMQPEQVRRSWSARIKRTLRSAPGFKVAKRLRNKLRASERTGSYSLLAILTRYRRPADPSSHPPAWPTVASPEPSPEDRCQRIAGKPQTLAHAIPDVP